MMLQYCRLASLCLEITLKMSRIPTLCKIRGWITLTMKLTLSLVMFPTMKTTFMVSVFHSFWIIGLLYQVWLSQSGVFWMPQLRWHTQKCNEWWSHWFLLLLPDLELNVDNLADITAGLAIQMMNIQEDILELNDRVTNLETGNGGGNNVTGNTDACTE